MTEWLGATAQDASMLALFIGLFLVAKYLKRALTPYDIEHELTRDDNAAQATALAGYYIGFSVIFCGAYLGPSQGWLLDLLLVGGYTLLGLVLLNVSRKLNGRYLLHRMSVVKEIRDEHNPAAGVVLAGNFIASALIVAGAIHGEGGGLITALVFYALGQLVLLGFGWYYEWLTPYDIQEEVDRGNLAAGFGFGGSLVAIGLIIMAGVGGDFIGWGYNLAVLAVHIVGVFIYLLLVRLFFDKVILARGDLNHEIANDANTGAGVLELALAISFATVLFFLIG